MGSDPPMSFSDQTIVSIKSRISDMGLHSDTVKTITTERERELRDMVEKLLDSHIDPEQLERQAEFINWLTIQRDLLVRSFEEERRRWESERDGWARMAEALIAQGARNAMAFGGRDEALERQYAVVESENRVLKEKLQDANARYSTLESELNKLKPLLLMQPPSLFDFSDPKTTSTATTSLPESIPVQNTKSESRRGKRRDSKATNVTAVSVKDEDSNKLEQSNSKVESQSIPQINGTTPKRSTTNQASDYYRKLDSPQTRSNIYQSPLTSFVHSTGRFSVQQTPSRPSHNTTTTSTVQTPSTHPGLSKKSKIKNKKLGLVNDVDKLLPVTADARTEHLLLAARKIGRERANIMSGFMRRIVKEQEKLSREKELERLERLNSTGTGNTTNSSSYYRKEALLDDGTLMTSPASFIGSFHNTPNPKTPKRGSTTMAKSNAQISSPDLMTPKSSDYYSNSNHHHHQHLTPGSFVFVGTPTTTGSSYGTLTMNTSTGGKMNSNTHILPVTSSSFQAVPVPPTQQTNQKGEASIKTPARTTSTPTPFDSLLSAARSMVQEGDGDTTPTAAAVTATRISTKSTGGRRKANVIELPESPVPKRRRIGKSNSSSKIGDKKGNGMESMIGMELIGTTKTKTRMLTPTSTPTPVRSALDVLADQAAAAFSSETQTPTKASSSSVNNKGRSNGLMRGSRSGFSMDADEENEEDNNEDGDEEEDLEATPKGKTMFMPMPTRGRARGNSLRSQNTKRKLSGGTSIMNTKQPGSRMIIPSRSPEGEEEENRQEVALLPLPEINEVPQERNRTRNVLHSSLSGQRTSMTEMNTNPSDEHPRTTTPTPSQSSPTNNTDQNDEDAEGENDPDIEGNYVSPVQSVVEVVDANDTDVDAEGDVDIDDGSLGPSSSGPSFVNASASRSKNGF